MTELYDEYGVTCSECFAIVKHYVLADEIAYCEDHAPVSEVWLKFDAEDDEDPSHTATVTGDADRGYQVDWWHEDVGLVVTVDTVFLNLEDAHDWLESAGYADYTA